MIGVSEAINLGIRLGLEPEMIAQVINTSSGRCWSSDTYNPCPGIIEGIPSSNNYQGGFASQLMTKVSRDDFFWQTYFLGTCINLFEVHLITHNHERICSFK